jgi:hypothetical protein
MENNNSLIKNNLVNENYIQKNIIKEGKKILQENDFFSDLDYIMNDDSFRSFYSKYFKDYTDVKIIILYMKLYETIQVEYKERYNMDIEKELLAYIIKELMCDDISRKNIIESFNNYIESNNNNDKKYLIDIFEKKNKIKQINI